MLWALRLPKSSGHALVTCTPLIHHWLSRNEAASNSTLLSSTVTGNMSAAQEIASDWQKQQRQ